MVAKICLAGGVGDLGGGFFPSRLHGFEPAFVDRSFQLGLEIGFHDAVEVTGPVDDLHGPIGADLLQGFDVHPSAKVAVSDNHSHRHVDRLHFLLAHRQFAQLMHARCRS